MDNTSNLSTGNAIVDAVGTMNFSGNIIPEAWYHTVVNDKGKVNSLAIHILADIVYWYRPTENRDEDSLSVTYTKKFCAEDFLQRSYDQLSEKFNISKNQARDAVVFLEELGVIQRHLRNLPFPNGPLSNVMFLELIPSVLKELTYPGSKIDACKNPDTSLQKSRDMSEKINTLPCQKEETYTKTTTEITTNISTTTLEDEKSSLAVDEIKRLFSGLGLSDKDIASIAKASDYDIEKCKLAKTVLDQQTKKIGNVAGWLIKAIKEGYKPVSKSPAKKKNSFHNFTERTYDYDALEKKLLLESFR